MLSNLDIVFHSWAAPLAGIVLCLAALFLFTRFKERKQRRLQAFARAQSIDFYDDGLPAHLPTEILAEIQNQLPSSVDVMHCFSGLRRGEVTLSFEYAAGLAELKHTITVAAVRRQHPETPIAETPGVSITHVGAWAIARRNNPVGLLRAQPETVVGLWDMLHTTTSQEAVELERRTHTNDNLHIAPRRDRRRAKVS